MSDAAGLSKGRRVKQEFISTAGSVLGIDVGCSPSRRSSAVCRLDWDATSVSWNIERFRAVEPERITVIARVADHRALKCAAFDGPLRSGMDVIGVYRVAEMMLTRRLQPFIGKPGQSSAPIGKLLNAHANECVRAVRALNLLGDAMHPQRLGNDAVVEAFPSSFLGLLIDDPNALNARRGDRSDTFFVHLADSGALDELVRHLLPGRRLKTQFATVKNHDDRAALVCALTALCVSAGDYCAVGDDNGWVILPPKSHIRSWAWSLLEVNATDPLHLVCSALGLGLGK